MKENELYQGSLKKGYCKPKRGKMSKISIKKTKMRDYKPKLGITNESVARQTNSNIKYRIYIRIA